MSEDLHGTAIITRALVRAAGLSLQEVLQAARVEPAALYEGMDYAQGQRVWDAVAELSGDAMVGHRTGAQLRLNDLGVIATAFSHVADLRTGLLTAGKLMSMAMKAVTIEVEADELGVEVIYQRPAGVSASRHGVEAIFAGFLSLSRQSTGRAFAVESITLSTPRPADTKIYDDFYGQPVRWGAELSFMEIGAAEAKLPMIGADPSLAKLLLAHAPELLRATEPGKPDIERRISRAFWSALQEGSPTIVGTARRAGMSPRTLQRRLSDAGWSFSELRERLVEERALALLRDDSVAIEQIAAAVGYDSRSSFDRAFRRWTGQTPAQFRRQALRG